MSFFISPRLATIYLIAVIVLGALLLFISKAAMKYFDRAFKRYDDLNESVQENVSAIRVVKAYVREDYEKKRFSKAAQNIYDVFVKAESLVVYNSPLMQFTVYACILLISWLGAHMVVSSTLTTGDLMALLTYPQRDHALDTLGGGGVQLRFDHAAVFPVVHLAVHHGVGVVFHIGGCGDRRVDLFALAQLWQFRLLIGAANVFHGIMELICK